ncbi:dnaJ homolog subfamily C member 2-like [Hippocampus comes]|uniref:dnaJ homolog subfamily C member 2-like n=1 Tax=Hippocampus comes TaxID=109280 RepID=UPI00094E24AB|nr:PREDICTED: dnaJ homolog subfamily C member 2-like [Hippocampus comes]
MTSPEKTWRNVRRNTTTVSNMVPAECFEARGGDGTAAHWPPEEQKLLEEALKTYPVITLQHWDKIPARNKKNCMQRHEEVVEKIEAKKAAQEQKMTTQREFRVS